MKRAALLLFVLACVSCHGAPNPETEAFNRSESLILTNAAENGAFLRRMLTAIEGAEIRILASFGQLEDETLARALVRAEARGVDVRVVSDVDQREDAGLAILLRELPALENGKPRVRLLGGDLSYSPQPNRDLVRSAALNRITDTFLVVDANHVLNVSEGYGSLDKTRWAFDVTSTDVAKDFEDEHTQLFGGVSATTLSYFDNMLKSNMNNRVYYPMADSAWEFYFGPQERLIKRVIDEVYAARASVQIVTSKFTNTFLVDALRYKAQVGVIVDMMVDEAHVGESGSQFRDFADVIEKDGTSADLRLGQNLGVTVVVIDAETARDGRRYQTRVMVLSHELAESIPFDTNDVSRASDFFMDGNMWVLSRPSADDNPTLESALRSFDRTFASGKKP